MVFLVALNAIITQRPHILCSERMALVTMVEFAANEMLYDYSTLTFTNI